MKSFELYIEQLNPACDALFQRPRDNDDINDDIWYQNRPMSKDTLGSLILNISKDAGLSKTYTNYSLRSTSITTLDGAGFEGRDIKTVSKHKCLDSVERYCKDSSFAKKKKMNNTLRKLLYHEPVNDNFPTYTRTNENATCMAVPVNVELMALNELDILDDSVLLSPEVDRVLNDISSQ